MGHESSPLCPGLGQMFDKIIRQQASELSRGVCRGRAEKGLAQGHTQHLHTTEMQWRIQGTRIGQAWVQIPALPRYQLGLGKFLSQPLPIKRGQ